MLTLPAYENDDDDNVTEIITHISLESLNGELYGIS